MHFDYQNDKELHKPAGYQVKITLKNNFFFLPGEITRKKTNEQ